MSHAVLRVVANQLQQAEFFTVMVDECVDCAHDKQLVICFRYVEYDLTVHEEFMGLAISMCKHSCRFNCSSFEGHPAAT